MRNGMIRATTLLVGLATAMTALTATAQKRVTVPAGTRILVRMADSIDSSQQKAGYRFMAAWRQICKPTTWWWREEAPPSMAYLPRLPPPAR